MTQPIGPEVACLLHYLRTGNGQFHDVSHNKVLSAGITLADQLDPCPIRHMGRYNESLDWPYVCLSAFGELLNESLDRPYVCLSAFGELLVEEMIAAARAVTQ